LKKINFAIGIHNHQPVGNFDFVFEEAYQRAYLPFLEVHEKHPSVKLAQHYSGILLEWIAEHHPEFIKRLKKFVRGGAVEMMTGGYYEPILITIPDEDKVGQINKLTQYVRDVTGYAPRGMWVAERVWEPYLPEPLAKAGVEYTALDDAHFKYAGLREQDLGGYYITESNGAVLKIFPISEKLRYTMPFRPPEESIEILRSLATEAGDRLIVFADDGEKFGVWPGTFEQCYENGWLDQFFSLLEENSDWINIMTFSEALENLNPAGRVYLPAASYREMMEWALPAHAIHEYEEFEQWLQDRGMPEENKVFIRGGFWRNFLAKYAESNNMHKRMLRGSFRLSKLMASSKAKKLQMARDHIYAGQCNCPYWHGVFGGLYLPHIRSAIYNNLIRADVEMDEIEQSAAAKKSGWTKYEFVDFDCDGHNELVVETDVINLFFAPGAGAHLFEFDFKPKAFNIIDTMTRREEGYHRKLLELAQKRRENEYDDGVASIHDILSVKEEGLEKYLNYDWYRRTSLVDHFLHPQTELEYFAKAQYGEQGDFVDHPYSVHVSKQEKDLIARFARNGHVWVGDEFVPVYLSKSVTIRPKSSEISVRYLLKNNHTKAIQLWFGTEFAFSLLAGNAPDRYYIVENVDLDDNRLASTGATNDVKSIKLRDEWLGLEIEVVSAQKADIWRFPIETISMSEAGFERVYQCSIVMPNWKINLEPGQKWQTIIEQKIRTI